MGKKLRSPRQEAKTIEIAIWWPPFGVRAFPPFVSPISEGGFSRVASWEVLVRHEFVVPGGRASSICEAGGDVATEGKATRPKGNWGEDFDYGLRHGMGEVREVGRRCFLPLFSNKINLVAKGSL